MARTHHYDLINRPLETGLADRLTERRAKLFKESGGGRFNDYSLPHVAQKIGISKVALYNWESGYTLPATITLWESWARALDMRLKVELN